MEPRWVRSLPTPDRCQVCGTSLPRGIPAWWDAGTGQVWCQGCRPGPLGESGLEPERFDPVFREADPETQGRWRRLLGVLGQALQVGSAEARTALAGHRWTPLALGQERTFCEGRGGVRLHPDLDRLAGRLRSGQSLCYGWPAVVLPGPGGLTMAPVFLAGLAPPPYLHREVPVQEEAILNPCLALPDSWKAEHLRDGLPLGDPERLMDLAEQVGIDLGLPLDALDPWRLRYDCPRTPGLYNLAVALLVEAPTALRGTLEELRALQERSDWTGTAAASLLGLEAPESEDRVGMPAAPVPLTEAWEKVLGRLRRGAQASLLAPDDQEAGLLALAALANAWLDGDRVLVSWAHQEGLDQVLERAGQVHPGMLLATGAGRVREAIPVEVARLLSDLMEAPPSGRAEEEAREDLARAVEARRQVLLEERRTALVADLNRLLAEQEELARRLWGEPGSGPAVDPAQVESQAERLGGVRFLGGWRRRRYLRGLGVQPQAAWEDLLTWARTSRASVRALEQLATLPPEDPGLRREREAAWHRATRRAVVACIRRRLASWSAPLEALSRLPPGAPGLARALRAVLPGPRGWASPLEGLNASLPLEAGLFDVGILGAADGCGLARALPLAYRCRRLLTLGVGRSRQDQLRMDPRRWQTLLSAFGFTEHELRARGLDPVHDSAWEAFAGTGSGPGTRAGEE